MGKGKETTTQEMPKFQQDYLRNTVLPFATQISETPFQAYTGPMAPTMSGYTTQAADIYSGMAGQDQTQQLLDTTQALYNPYQQNVIDASLAQMGRQQQQALTGLEGQLAGSGAFGSRGEVARGEFAAGNLASQNQLIADMMRQGYSEAQARAMGVMQQQQAQQGAAAAGLTGIGGMETALSAAEIDALRNEFMREQQDPYQKLAALQGGASTIPTGIGTTTATKTPGLFDYLTLAASNAEGIGKAMAGGSDIRLKDNVQPLENVGGVQFYSWDWNDEGKKVAHKDQPTFGVIADELQETHPHLVTRGGDGYLRVNYVGLAKELDG